MKSNKNAGGKYCVCTMANLKNSMWLKILRENI